MSNDDRRERYAEILYYHDFPNEGLWRYAEHEHQEKYRGYADSIMTVADVDIFESGYQLRLAQLELMKANVLRELAEIDLKGVKASMKEYQAQVRNLQVMYDVSNNRVDDLIQERDEYQTALKAIRTVLNDTDRFDPYSAQDSEAIDTILKGLGL